MLMAIEKPWLGAAFDPRSRLIDEFNEAHVDLRPSIKIENAFVAGNCLAAYSSV